MRQVLRNGLVGFRLGGDTWYLGGVTAAAGTDSTGLAFGIRHRF